MENVINELHDTEKEAAKLKEKADKDSREIVAKAKTNSEKSMQDLIVEMDEQQKLALDKASKQVLKQVNDIRSEGEKLLGALEKKGNAVKKKAVEIVINTVLRG
jgi:vacuolar-type H+-ATPase subunit H